VSSLDDRPLNTPRESRLPMDHPMRAAILAAHDAALDRNEDGYIDPTTGWWVFSARYLVDREVCCLSGCRHCPYQD
jgi:hypothetical protein